MQTTIAVITEQQMKLNTGVNVTTTNTLKKGADKTVTLSHYSPTPPPPLRGHITHTPNCLNFVGGWYNNGGIIEGGIIIIILEKNT